MSDNPDPVHTPAVRKGEHIRDDDGKEAGREESETTGAGRPAGKSDARDSTSVNPQDANPIDPKSPKLPPA